MRLFPPTDLIAFPTICHSAVWIEKGVTAVAPPGLQIRSVAFGFQQIWAFAFEYRNLVTVLRPDRS